MILPTVHGIYYSQRCCLLPWYWGKGLYSSSVFDVHKCTAFMPFSNPSYTSVTLPRMEGITRFFLKIYTKIGLAMITLTDTAEKMIKARQHESGNTVVCSLHYNYCVVLCSSGCVVLVITWPRGHWLISIYHTRAIN